MAHTTNYSIPLPQLGEPADIRVVDRGTEMIDDIMHGNRTMVAPAWVSTETYNTGNRVVYLGEYYKCKEDNVTGAWDATKWDKTTVGEDIEGLGTGGASALADLDDVEITNPSTGQALLFDDDDDVWKNQDLPDVSVTKEASGNPIEITDAAAAPLVKCVTEIQGSQDLHGYDKPWVGGAGKNKLPMTVSGIKALNTNGTWSGDTYTYNNITFTIETDGDENVTGILIQGTTTGYPYFDFPVVTLTQGTYIFSMGARYRIFDNATSTQIADTINPYTLQVTDSSHEYKVRIFTGNVTNMDVTALPLVRLSNESATFSPYSNICPITAYTEGEIEVRGKNIFNKDNPNVINTYISTYGDIVNNTNTRTIYIKCEPNTAYTVSKNAGRRFSVGYTKTLPANGVHAYGVVVNDTGTSITITTGSDAEYLVSYIYHSSYDSGTAQDMYNSVQIEKGTTPTTYEPYTSTTHTTTFPDAIYRGSEDVVNGEVECDFGMIDLSTATLTSLGNTPVWKISNTGAKPFPNSEKANIIAEAYDAIRLNGLSNYVGGIAVRDSGEIYINTGSDMDAPQGYAAYELATPTTTPVTVSNIPIRTLSGYNHIESSTGDMEIEYIRDTYQPLVDLIQSSSHVYSTAEQVVGKWIDGKTLYERTIIFQNVISLTANAFTDVYDLSTIGVESLVEFTPYTDNVAPLRPFGYFIPDITSANMLRLNIPNTGWYIGGMTIRYTKTTATRSLSAPLTAQKAQIEPLTDKTEEVPTEEEKTVEMPETEEENDER